MQETANKQKRMTLKSVHQMLDGMSVELAEKVHLLFMAEDIESNLVVLLICFCGTMGTTQVGGL